jgi:holin-like protein
MFVPAGVGIMSLLPLLSSEYPAIIAALIGSTVLTILVTAVVMNALLRQTRKDRIG